MILGVLLMTLANATFTNFFLSSGKCTLKLSSTVNPIMAKELECTPCMSSGRRASLA